MVYQWRLKRKDEMGQLIKLVNWRTLVTGEWTKWTWSTVSKWQVNSAQVYTLTNQRMATNDREWLQVEAFNGEWLSICRMEIAFYGHRLWSSLTIFASLAKQPTSSRHLRCSQVLLCIADSFVDRTCRRGCTLLGLLSCEVQNFEDRSSGQYTVLSVAGVYVA